MGTCSSIYIEFKKRSDKQWHLLDYVDSIPETVHELTPESKAWERLVPNPCYHKGKAELYAFFTEVALKDRWGDDWDDAPYEYRRDWHTCGGESLRVF